MGQASQVLRRMTLIDRHTWKKVTLANTMERNGEGQDIEHMVHQPLSTGTIKCRTHYSIAETAWQHKYKAISPYTSTIFIPRIVLGKKPPAHSHVAVYKDWNDRTKELWIPLREGI